LARLIVLVWTQPAWAAGPGLRLDHPATSILVFSALSFACACCFWAFSERTQALTHRRKYGEALACLSAALALRDAIISAGTEAVVFCGEPSSLDCAGDTALLHACASGPDFTALSAARDMLVRDGSAFSLQARTADGRVIATRGCPVGGRAVLFLREQKTALLSEVAKSVAMDYRIVLDAIPIPMWVRGDDLRLKWANRAFLAASGTTLEKAIAGGLAFVSSERDLAGSVRDVGEPVKAKRYAIIDGVRRSISLSLHPLPDGSIAGLAHDASPAAETPIPSGGQSDVYNSALDSTTTAISIFRSNSRLVYYNRAYARLWGLPESWLDSHPTRGEIFERLREIRRLPEQSDFAAWKAEHLKTFERTDHRSDELWHLPDGRSVRVTERSSSGGGLIVTFDDLSDQLRLESSYKAQIDVHKATLETLKEGVAVFGPDGRLKLTNTAFGRLWQLAESELSGELHMNRIAETCGRRFGKDCGWDIVSAAVNSTLPPQESYCEDVELSDGRVLSLSLARLPDGATLASFADATDAYRLNAALGEWPVDTDEVKSRPKLGRGSEAAHRAAELKA